MYPFPNAEFGPNNLKMYSLVPSYKSIPENGKPGIIE